MPHLQELPFMQLVMEPLSKKDGMQKEEVTISKYDTIAYILPYICICRALPREYQKVTG